MSAVSPKVLVPLLVAALALTGACSSLADPPALTINGTEISAASIDGELQELQENDDYRSIAENDCGGPAAGLGEGTFDSACVARLLSLRAYYELIEQDLAERGREISEDDLLAAREELELDLTPEGAAESVLGGFGQALQDRLVRRYALIAALRDEVSGEAAGTDAQQAFYEENPEQFEQACASHILASIEGRTSEEARAEAQAIADRIAAGEDFAALATNESDDPGAAAQAGALQCGPRGQFTQAFDDQVFALPVGTLSAPVETEFGWHLILVTSREVPPFDLVQPQIEQALQQEASTAIGDVLSELTCDADVTVDPRFGRWDEQGCGGETGDVARVAPPEGPISTTDTSLAPLP